MVYVANVRLPTEKAHGYQIMKMCEAFSENGCDVILLRPYRSQVRKDLRKSDPFKHYAVRKSFRITTVPFPDPLRLEKWLPKQAFLALVYAWMAFWGLISSVIAKRMQADIYYTREPSCAFFMALLGLGPVFEAHSVGAGARRLKHVKSKLRMVVAVTEKIKDMLVDLGLEEGSVIVQPDSVDPAMYQDLPAKDMCRKKLGLPADAFIIGFVGRFIVMGEERGIPELVMAVGEVCKRKKDKIRLVCVGGPMDNVARYLAFASEAGIPDGRAMFFDLVPAAEVPLWIKSLDVAVIPYTPSIHYSFFVSPMKAFEYMAAGIPILASDLPSLREVLDDGRNAVLVKPGDPEAMAEGIIRLLEDEGLRERLMQGMAEDVAGRTWARRAREIIMEAAKRDGR